MRKFLVILVLFLVVVAGLIVSLPYIVPLSGYRSEIESAAHNATGRLLRISGPLRLTFYPHFGLRAEQVTFANMPGGRAAAMASVGDIDLSIKVLPLLAGKVELDRIVLVHPVVALEVDSAGRENWNFGETKSGESSVTLPANTQFAGVGIEDGRIAYDNFKTGTHRALDHVNADIGLTRLDAPVTATGDLVLGNGPVNFSATITTIKTLLSNGATTFALGLHADALDAGFTGRMAPDGTTSGHLAFSSRALKSAAALLGERLPARFTTASLTADVVYEAKIVTLSPLRLTLDKQAITGDLTLDERGSIPAVSGALSAAYLDLNPFLGGSAASTQPGWSRTPIDLSALKEANAKMSLTAGGLKLRQLRFGRTVATITLQDGGLTAAFDPVTLYGGAGQAIIGVDTHAGLPQYKAHLDIRHVALAPFLSDAMGVASIEGSGELGLDVVASGASANAAMHTIAGRGSIAAVDGRLRGVDLGGVSRTVQSVLDVGATSGGASTGYHDMGGTFAIANGVLATSDFRITGPIAQMTGAGTLDIGNRGINFRLVPKAGVAGLSVGIPFRVTGSWDHLHYAPDLAGVVGGAVNEIQHGAGSVTNFLGIGASGNTSNSKSNTKGSGSKSQNPLSNMLHF